MAHRTTSAPANQDVAFFKVGGTWDMTKNAKGRLSGAGGLDDQELSKLEHELYVNNGRVAELHLMQAMQTNIEESIAHPNQISEKLGWVPHVEHYVNGSYFSIYSGDSSHLRSSLIAPIANQLLHYANEHPKLQLIGAQGTDTADSALIPLLDTFLFDTHIKPILFTGANRTQEEWNSDAPRNFSDLIQLTGAHLPAGAYWVFSSHLYRASDMLKIDPTESRRIENFSTFFAPRGTAQFTKKVIGENPLHHPVSGRSVKKGHPLEALDAKKLFDAMELVNTIDLGLFNPVAEDVVRILDSSKRGLVVCGFALGNGSNPIKHAIAKAAQMGKVVIVIDRTLIGVVNGRYDAGLMWAGEGEKYPIISGQRMSPAIARSLIVRALVAELNQSEAQTLVSKYCESRQLQS